MKYWRTPLDASRVTVPHGDVQIIVERCKGCGFCIEYCPRDVLAESPAFNRKGYHPPEVVKPGSCVNCNLCEMICPDFAIFSVPASPAGPRGVKGVAAQGAGPPSARASEFADIPRGEGRS